ncbi:hypothetical protein [Cohnella caldifontis]|uniref:hypothetical protein n=1 Tax=Cohnella caldifontis TaxID=3027471 RepID=UPI0023ED8E15|nr:hypothetical protein [Cohnella sp. YIM B05605]
MAGEVISHVDFVIDADGISNTTQSFQTLERYLARIERRYQQLGLMQIRSITWFGERTSQTFDTLILKLTTSVEKFRLIGANSGRVFSDAFSNAFDITNLMTKVTSGTNEPTSRIDIPNGYGFSDISSNDRKEGKSMLKGGQVAETIPKMNGFDKAGTTAGVAFLQSFLNAFDTSMLTQKVKNSLNGITINLNVENTANANNEFWTSIGTNAIYDAAKGLFGKLLKVPKVQEIWGKGKKLFSDETFMKRFKNFVVKDTLPLKTSTATSTAGEIASIEAASSVTPYALASIPFIVGGWTMLEERAKNLRAERFMNSLENPTYYPNTYLSPRPERYWYSDMKDHFLSTIYENFPGLEPKPKQYSPALSVQSQTSLAPSVNQPLNIQIAPNSVQLNFKDSEPDYKAIAARVTHYLTMQLQQSYENRP